MTWLTSTLHARSLFCALILKDAGYSVRRCLCAWYWRAHAPSTVQFPRSFDSHLALKWSWSARLKRLSFDVVVKMFCDWINALLVKRKSDRSNSCEWVANPSPAPALIALNIFNVLNWKNPIACVNELILTPLFVKFSFLHVQILHYI